MNRLRIVRGDTNVYRIVVTRKDPDTGVISPINLSGLKIWFTAKNKQTDTDAAAVIRKGTTPTSLTGITVVDGPAGKADIELLPADTSTLATTTWLYYDVQILEGLSRITTVISGRAAVVPDATKTIT